MSKPFLSTENLPFCKGCGHAIVAHNTEKALQSIGGLSPLDVIVVTDIGCIGIIDKQYNTHTIHGLHGRSVALGTGISLSISEPGKKVIVLLGDGGATIGLQHIMEAAYRNVNMTVLVHNNMLYGMTGGQPSGTTPQGYKTPISPDGKPGPGLDLCKVIYAAGAPHVRRLIGIGDFSAPLAEAFSLQGFSFIEILEICTSYGIKFNPGKKVVDIAHEAGIDPVLLKNNREKIFTCAGRKSPTSLLEKEPQISQQYNSPLDRRYSIIISGSAGEGVQTAAELFIQAGIAGGLSVTKKGSYPVTVGVGFSTAEIILSPQDISFTGITDPDLCIAVSPEGLNKVIATVNGMKQGSVYLDASLAEPATKAPVVRFDYRTFDGPKNAALWALIHVLKQHQVFPVEAFLEAIRNSKSADKVDLSKIDRL
jgi:pyruvate/2-oxoacid:ferredoxin oxidoreductase beta subunit